MTDQGDRAPREESAASIAGRSAAIEAAFADIPDFDDDFLPSAVAEGAVETPSGDDQAEAQPQAQASPEDTGKPPVNESERPVEGHEASPKSQDALEAPKHWPADRRQEFQTLPDGAKRIILDRNKEANVAVTKAQQEAAQYRKTSEAVTSLFNDDHKQQMASAGMDEVGAMRYLVQQHDALNRDPVGFLRAVIAQTGVKAEQLFGGQPQQQAPANATPEPEEWVDPAVLALKQELAELKQWRTSTQQQTEAQQREQQTRFHNWFATECNAFENAIDDEGLPKYPHLANQAVMGNVVRLVQSDPALKQLLTSKPQEALERAYNDSLYLTPEIRQQLAEEAKAKWQAEYDASNSVKKAQAAATRKGSPGANGAAKVGPMSRTEAIDKAFRDLGM